MHYDFVVIGGGTSGCACAYTLGKSGKNVLLIEKNIHLGGSMTSAFVAPMMKSSDYQINTTFFSKFIEKLSGYKGQITYLDGNAGWFNHELAKLALDDLMCEANVNVIYGVTIKSLNITDRYIKSVFIDNNLLSVPIEAKYFIDSTGNSDICKLANCEFLDNNSLEQPINLRFTMSGIDLKSFSNWITKIDTDRNVTTSVECNGEFHCSTAYTWDSNKKWALKPLFDDAVANGIIKDEDRNYFQLFTIPGMSTSVSFNCPRIYFDKDINPLNPIEMSKALQKGRKSIFRLAKFCQKYFVGFENAYISNIADMAGIRVSRRVKGKYIYTLDDLKNGKTFDNPVLISNYPVDVHSNKINKSILEYNLVEYQLPVESLIVEDIENLFVTGRCLSADFYAQAALRIIPSCFSMGEGLAKYLLKIS